MYGLTESGHVEVAARRPLAGGHVADARADKHERAASVGEAADHAGPAPDLAVQAFDHVVRADAPAMLPGIVVEQVGRRLADALAQASGGLPEFPGFHVPGDGFRLLQRLVPRFHGEHGLRGVRRPVTVPGVDPGEDVAFEVDHAPLVAGVGQQFVHGRPPGRRTGLPSPVSRP